MEKRRKAFAATVLAFLLTTSAKADRFVLSDGRTLEGDVTNEDDKSVTVEVWNGGSSRTDQISKSQITTWYKPSHEGQPYVAIPVFGVIGEDITVDALRAGLVEARAAQPQYVILAIDSPGGNVGQMMDMIDVLNEASKDLKIVAYVKSAYSAAAVIAMSCRQVYMKPGATIGATVPFRMTENGPEDVDAKFRSVFEARIRAANDHAGHADLLIRAMSELDLELYLADDKGKPLLRASGPGKLIKSKGQILTLTANEAVECGFAQIAPTMVDLGNQVCGGAWYEVNRRAYNTTLATVVMQKQREREAIEQQQRLIATQRRQELQAIEQQQRSIAAQRHQDLETIEQQQRHIIRQNAVAQITPQLDSVERRMAELTARAIADQNAINDLTARCNQELQQISLEYQQAIRNIEQSTLSAQPPPYTGGNILNYNAMLQQQQAQRERNREAANAYAADVANNRASAVRQYIQANIAPLQADGQAAQIELGFLRDKEKQLLATIPSD